VHFDSFFLIQYFSNVKISIFSVFFLFISTSEIDHDVFHDSIHYFSSSVILLVNSKAWVTIFRSIVVKCEASKTTMRHRNSNLHHFSTMCILAPPSGGRDHSKLLVWITLAEKKRKPRAFTMQWGPLIEETNVEWYKTKYIMYAIYISHTVYYIPRKYLTIIIDFKYTIVFQNYIMHSVWRIQ